MRRRLQTAWTRGLTRFVGRQTEMAALHAALTQAGAGHGQMVAIVGEAGVGKSRLVDEFVQAADAQGWLVLDSAAVSYGQARPISRSSTCYGATAIWRRARAPHHPAKVTEQVLKLDATLQDTIPALLALLDALPADSPFLRLDRRSGVSARSWRSSGCCCVRVRCSPCCWSVEDLHWLDTETQALLESLSESLPTARLLLLVNYRPDYQHGWGSKTYYTQLRLDPLPPGQRRRLSCRPCWGTIRAWRRSYALLIARTEGNPFFLEESVRTLVETGVLVGEPGAYRLAHALPTCRCQPPCRPSWRRASTACRRRRSACSRPRRSLVRRCPCPSCRPLPRLPEEPLHRGLTHLQAAEFLYETRLFPELAYTFKHALTQEVAYGSLLQERRRALHARIVEALEALAGDRVAEQVERLAHHALRGEVWDKALAYCRQAGEKALARSAHREAVGYFEQALSALPHLPETRDTREQAIDLRLALRTALYPSGDFGRHLAFLREAEALAEALDDPRRLGQVSIFLANHFCHMGAYDQAIAAAQRALALATAGEDVVLQALANHYLGRAYQAQGDYRRAIDCFSRPWRPSRGRGATSASVSSSCPPCFPCLARRVPCRAGHVR